MARVLGVLRLSRDKEESTSIERQRAAIEGWAERKGHVVVGWAEDVDVSATIAPWNRPALGQWLPHDARGLIGKKDGPAEWEASRAGEFDVLCVWKLDRIARRSIHLWSVFDWCRQNGKTMGAAEDDYDPSTQGGQMMMGFLAMLAEGELEAIKHRAKSSFTHLVSEGRWRGGFVPYGYRAVKAETGKGWLLEPDPETAEVLRQKIVEPLLNGEAANAVVRRLNSEGIPSPLNAQRLRAGKAVKPSEWRVGNLLKMLRSPTLLGQAFVTEKDADGNESVRLVRGDDGLPLQRAEPILTREEWDGLQAVLDKNGTRQTGERSNGSLLLRVAYCECGEPMYRARGRSYHYYRCGTAGRASLPCPKAVAAIREDELNAVAVSAFMAFVGNLELIRREFVPGQNHAGDLADVERALTELREDRAAGLYSGERGTTEFRSMYRSLEARREALEAAESTPDAWREVPTGQSYRQFWDGLSTDHERNRALRDAGVRVVIRAKGNPVRTRPLFGDGDVHEGGRVELQIPGDLQARVRDSLGA